MANVDVSCLTQVVDKALSQFQFKELLQTNFNAQICSRSCIQTCIECINNPLPYGSFFSNFMLPNLPCILKSWATSNWPACKMWSKASNACRIPDFSQLEILCKNVVVPVADCSTQEFNDHLKIEMLFGEYVAYMNNKNKKTNSCLYLKDWHFFREFPHENIYSVAPYFASDWLNELFEKHLPPFDDDYRFLYIGPKDSWTPFHADVFHSYSWSANICGKKKWLLFPPSSEKNFQDVNGHLPFDITKALGSNPIEVIQEAGEIIFIPSGWYHQVHNLEDTISINHNWFNGCNLHIVWSFLQSELKDVENEISDCREMMNDDEWAEQCQMLMKANTGMNLHDFFAILENISSLRMKTLKTIIDVNEDENSSADLDSITEVCYTALLHVKSLTLKSDMQQHQSATVPFEIVDLCLLIPVLLSMCEYYHVKKIVEKSKFLVIISKCCTFINAFADQYLIKNV